MAQERLTHDLTPVEQEQLRSNLRLNRYWRYVGSRSFSLPAEAYLALIEGDSPERFLASESTDEDDYKSLMENGPGH